MKRQKSGINAPAIQGGAGIGRSGSMALLKQTSAGAAQMGQGGLGGRLASPFDEKTGFLL